MVKFKIHKNCSCKHCKYAKTKKESKSIERNLRRKSKQDLNCNPMEFENMPYSFGFFA